MGDVFAQGDAVRLTSTRAAIAGLGVLLLGTAGVLGLLEPTETRYSEIAREMRAGGDWLVPRLNGIAHFHKPPLPYWITAGGMSLFGENAWGARIPAILAGLLLLAFVARLARRFAQVLERVEVGAASANSAVSAPLAPAHVAGLAAWIAGTTLLFLGPGRIVSCDPYLATAVAAFWCFAPSMGALALLGVGFLIKGPVVFVPTVLPLLVVALWERAGGFRPTGEAAVTSWLGPRRGWWWFALIAAPWYVTLIVRVSGLMDYLLRTQLWQRYTTGVHHREGGWWYFIAVLIGGMVPWTPALISGMRVAWRRRGQRPARLLLAWLIAPLVFFSFSGSKLPAYLLPCLPPAVLLATAGLVNAGRGTVLGIAALLGALAIAGGILGPAEFAKLSAGAALPSLAWVALVAIAAAAVLVATRRFAAGAASFAVAMTLALVALAPYDVELGAPRRLALAIEEQRTANEPVVLYRRFNAGIPFHLRSKVLLLDVPRELQFEGGRGPEVTVADIDAFARQGRVWVAGPAAAIEELARDRSLTWHPVAHGGHETVGFLSLP